jgi:hypothetical protein
MGLWRGGVEGVVLRGGVDGDGWGGVKGELWRVMCGRGDIKDACLVTVRLLCMF